MSPTSTQNEVNVQIIRLFHFVSIRCISTQNVIMLEESSLLHSFRLFHFASTLVTQNEIKNQNEIIITLFQNVLQQTMNLPKQS